MPKILVLYHSTYGYTEQLAAAAAIGARSVPGAEVAVRRVPGAMTYRTAATQGGASTPGRRAPIARPEDVSRYDAIMIGTPVREGRMSGQLADFLDHASRLCGPNRLSGKVGSAFTAPALRPGGKDTLLFSVLSPTLHIGSAMLHLGMVIVGLPCNQANPGPIDEVRAHGMSAAGKSAGNGISRQPSPAELALIRRQGRKVAEVAVALARPFRDSAFAAPVAARPAANSAVNNPALPEQRQYSHRSGAGPGEATLSQ